MGMLERIKQRRRERMLGKGGMVYPDADYENEQKRDEMEQFIEGLGQQSPDPKKSSRSRVAKIMQERKLK